MLAELQLGMTSILLFGGKIHSCFDCYRFIDANSLMAFIRMILERKDLLPKIISVIILF
jgi:hypothetical protein